MEQEDQIVEQIRRLTNEIINAKQNKLPTDELYQRLEKALKRYIIFKKSRNKSTKLVCY